MACESQIWPRCTPRGITSLFRTKELIFETDRSKLSHFTRNYPVVAGVVGIGDSRSWMAYNNYGTVMLTNKLVKLHMLLYLLAELCYQTNWHKKHRSPATLVSLDSYPYNNNNSMLAPSLPYPGGHVSVLVQVQVLLFCCLHSLAFSQKLNIVFLFLV